eukprot:832413-Prymnesium_polylepis.2
MARPPDCGQLRGPIAAFFPFKETYTASNASQARNDPSAEPTDSPHANMHALQATAPGKLPFHAAWLAMVDATRSAFDRRISPSSLCGCLLYTSDAADDM